MPSGRAGSGTSVVSSRPVTHDGEGGASTGSRQPCSVHALLNGVNTLNGVPAPEVTRPGATAYGEPVRTSSMPASASAASTSRSRWWP